MMFSTLDHFQNVMLLPPVIYSRGGFLRFANFPPFHPNVIFMVIMAKLFNFIFIRQQHVSKIESDCHCIFFKIAISATTV